MRFSFKICFKMVVSGIIGALLFGLETVPVLAASEVTVVHSHSGSPENGGGCYTAPVYHTHTGNSHAGGGCYGEPVYHVHTGNGGKCGGCYQEPVYHVHAGDSTDGGGCYTVPVYHAHTGSAELGDGCYGEPVYHVHTGDGGKCGGCYQEPVYHVHTGSSKAAGGCYQMPVYHTHTGNSHAGGGCYQTPIYHVHSGSPGTSKPNGCYTKAENKVVAKHCGMYVDQGNGYWHCDHCDSCIPTAYVPGNRQHDPVHGETVYELGCNKTTSTVEGYQRSCGKTEKTIEQYSLSCGKTVNTVEKYALNCGKNESTIEKYVLSCGKDENTPERYEPGCGKTTHTVERYALSCGRTENTVEKYALGCGKTGNTVERYQLSCGKGAGESIGKLWLEEGKKTVSVHGEGVIPTAYQWNTGCTEKTLQNSKPGTAYSCTVAYMDGAVRRSVILDITTAPGEKGTSASEKAPSTSGKAPSGVEKAPSASGKAPSGAEKVPSTSEKKSAMQEKKPSAADEPAKSAKPAVSGNDASKSKDDGLAAQGQILSSQQQAWQPIKVLREDKAAQTVDTEAADDGWGIADEMLSDTQVQQAQMLRQEPQAGEHVFSMIWAGAAGGILFITLCFLWSRYAVLYCYNTEKRYERLGVLFAKKVAGGYMVKLSERKLANASIDHYRIAVGMWMRKRYAKQDFVIVTGRQKLTLTLEEYVDFAL